MNSRPIRVLFLTLYPEMAASPRYRVAQFLPYLRENGFECVVACAVSEARYASLVGAARRPRPFWYHCAETFRRIRQIISAAQFDIVFIQKAIMSAYLRGMPRFLRSRSARVIYDLDDAVHLQPPHPLRRMWRALEDRRQITRLFSTADLVLAGNAWLKSEAERFGGNAALFPTVVDTNRFIPTGLPTQHFCIGWMGNPSTTPHLEVIGSDLTRVPNAAIRLVGADRTRAPWPGADMRPWSLHSEVKELQQFSVGLMPLPKTDWSRGKCALKALQYMACGIPCIGTPYGALLDIIRHEENGMFADSPKEWLEAIERLRDPALRRHLGEAGRATVESSFALDRASPRLCELLKSAL